MKERLTSVATPPLKFEIQTELIKCVARLEQKTSMQSLKAFSDSRRIKPILKWAGGKSGLLSQLHGLFPKVARRYIEPFFGGGAVFFSFEKVPEAVINDFNHEIVNLYCVTRDHPRQLMSHLDKLANQYSEDFYYKMRKTEASDALEQAARTLFLNKTGFNGLYRQNSTGLFNVPFGKRVSCPALYDDQNLLSVSKRLSESQILNLDFEAVIDQATAGDFVYCDPPYEPLSATSSFNAYKGGGFSRDDQVRLFLACRRAQRRGAYVLVSNSSADFIKQLYSGCRTELIKAKRAINSKANSRGEIEEIALILDANLVN